ncbi:hypothetical protein ACLMJK_008232 [Lecanora helva]
MQLLRLVLSFCLFALAYAQTPVGSSGSGDSGGEGTGEDASPSSSSSAMSGMMTSAPSSTMATAVSSMSSASSASSTSAAAVTQGPYKSAADGLLTPDWTMVGWLGALCLGGAAMV